MKQPWAITPGGEVVRVEPERWLFEPGAWDDVEAAIGTRLPGDYKELIGDGPACVFDEELLIASPFDPVASLNLISVAARTGWTLAYVREDFPDAYPVAVYPERGGLLGWGTDGGGGDYYWDTASPDPDQWTVAVSGRPIFDPHVQPAAYVLSAYLEALAAGEIKAATLAEWPSPGAKVVRRAT
jgi:hypothetical protein